MRSVSDMSTASELSFHSIANQPGLQNHTWIIILRFLDGQTIYHRQQIIQVKTELGSESTFTSTNDQMALLFSDVSISSAHVGNKNKIAQKCGLEMGQLRSLLRDPVSYKLDDDGVYALLCSVASRSHKQVVVVNPQVSASLFFSQDDPSFEVLARENVFGDIANYEIILLPIYDGTRSGTDSRHTLGLFEGHWMLVVHNKHGPTIFFDSFSSTNRLNYLNYHIVRILRDLDPELNSVTFVIRPSRVGVQHNEQKQTDVNSCGFHLVLYAEAYLAHGGNTMLQNFDIVEERKRLIDHLSKLFFTDSAEYTPRPVEKSIFGMLIYCIFQFLCLSKF